MANFILIVDPDSSRRAAFCADAWARIAPLPGLVQGGCSSGDFQAAWAVGARAPIAFASDDRGAAALWGEALHEDGRRVEIRGLRAAWSDPDARTAPFDGYHAAVVYQAEKGLLLGADLIGMFPIYWWASGGVLLAGSSPELFRLHPSFRSRVDIEGLAAMLLTMYSVGGRTLLDGVRRLAPGNLLRARPGKIPEERENYRLPLSARYHDMPFSAQVELLHEVLEDAVHRHVPRNEACTLALSGGRDSRLVAGLLERQGSSVTALTFGERGDMEMSCATGVARATGFAHRTLPLAVDPEGECAVRHARWLHCTTGFGSLAHWGSPARMDGVPSRLVTGYVMDVVVGGSHFTWAYDRVNRQMSFDSFFARINAHGVAEDTLRGLLGRGPASDLVDCARSRIQSVYDSYSDVESQRAWCFDIHHRQRFHVGNPPWMFSFASWPVQPALDQRVLSVAGGLPVSTLAERRAQDEMLKRFYPHLAELPLDRNSFNTEPLSPRVRYLVGQYIGQRLAPLRKLVPGRGDDERRFYYRVFDFNSPGWQAVRRLAEPYRDRLDGLLDRDRLDEYLPPPDVELRVKNGIVDSSGRKMLVGLMLWARDHM